MSTLMCASLCGNVCGMFHHSPVTNECSTFREKSYDSGVVLSADPDWTTSYRQNHAAVEQGDWTMVFRAQKEIGVSVWDTWNNAGVHDDNPIPSDFPFACLRLADYSSCDRHFRSHILDNWVGIKEVRFSFIKENSEVAFVLFNGTDTSRDSWFSQDRILDSSWYPHLINEVTLTETGIYGHYNLQYVARRFYLFGPHNGCADDWVYTMVIDRTNEPCLDSGNWHIPPFQSMPTFYYSPTSLGRASLRTDKAYPLAQTADVLAVHVKFA
ncbi:hypothetical protein EGW08_004027 [Elysia chlorotica]|uniref:Uncharacterized protein n=1 Tax=Elysia chlorotica TaxID=188477 RepID=A0A3S1HXM3_ELYCH|nr:hypothetical protein EGW08_004027 [Elysia chlorotica]